MRDGLLAASRQLRVTRCEAVVDRDPRAPHDEVAVVLLEGDALSAQERARHRLGGLALRVDERAVEIEQKAADRHRFAALYHAARGSSGHRCNRGGRKCHDIAVSPTSHDVIRTRTWCIV